MSPAAQRQLEGVRREQGLPALHRLPTLDWAALGALRLPFGRTARVMAHLPPHRQAVLWRWLGPTEDQAFVSGWLRQHGATLARPELRRYGLARRLVWPGYAVWCLILLDDPTSL